MSNTTTLEEANELELELTVNELLRVQLPDDPNSDNYYSRIENIEGKMLSVTLPTDNRGAPLPIHPDMMLSFSLVRDGNAYAFNGLVDKVPDRPLPVVTIIVSSAIERIQRRQDFRVKCLIPVEIIAALPEVSSELKPTVLRLKTSTYDLSASGVSLRISMSIPVGTFPLIILSLPDEGSRIRVSCRVVHCFAAPDNTGRFHIGIQFMNLEENNRARIVRFVYRSQLKGIRK